MTSYFDTRSGDVRDLPRDIPDDDFVKRVYEIEQPTIATVLKVAEDREFPEDLRARIQNAIKTRSAIAEDGRDYVLATRASHLLDDLHSIFHALASRRVKTRFGRWSDSPTQNIVSILEHDENEEGESDEQGDLTADGYPDDDHDH